MSDVLDLDALVPEQVTIKFGNKEIQVKPPSTGDVLRLGFFGQKLATPEEIKDDELDKVITDLTAQIHKCIPELEGAPLNTAQLLKLVEVVSNMAIPPDVKDLKDRGISTDDPKAP